MKRDKSKFLKWFSFSRHKRRFGAEHLSDMIDVNFGIQKNHTIDTQTKQYTFGSSNDIKEHFEQLKHEFHGLSELCYTHAKLIVLIRRDFKTKNHFELFQKLWHQESKHLLKHLNTRWLISACDAFFDYSDCEKTKSLALSAIFLINTIKIQETEHYANHYKSNISDEMIESLQAKRVGLFDGTSAFAIGTDDTLRNMRWRLNKIAKNNIVGEILLELFNRVNTHNTVYKRMKDKHTRDKTSWW